MFKFFFKRILMVIPTFIAITFITFALVHFIPGDPVEIMMGERGLTPEIHQQMMHQLGLDLPLHEQYFNYGAKVLQGDFGHDCCSKKGQLDFSHGYSCIAHRLFYANFLVGIDFNFICFTTTRFTARWTFR